MPRNLEKKARGIRIWSGIMGFTVCWCRNLGYPVFSYGRAPRRDEHPAPRYARNKEEGTRLRATSLCPPSVAHDTINAHLPSRTPDLHCPHLQTIPPSATLDPHHPTAVMQLSYYGWPNYAEITRLALHAGGVRCEDGRFSKLTGRPSARPSQTATCRS